ncbi:hypothetical protein GC207_01760 [bacterium]|nr:hypothetical protein [bacterium]
MTIVAPIAAATALVCWSPERWGGSLSPVTVFGMAIFGVLTIPLWPTYIPAIVLTPIAMNKIATIPAFRRSPLVMVGSVSILVGGICGVLVISIIVPWRESTDVVLNWLLAGAAAGAVALPMISLIYRCSLPIAESSATLNGELFPQSHREDATERPMSSEQFGVSE